MARRSKFTDAQIIGFVREVESGATVVDVARRAGVTQVTFYRWKAKFGGMTVSEAQDKRRLEDENRRLKQIVAEQVARHLCIEERLGKKVVTTSKRRDVVDCFQRDFSMSERRACRLVGLHRSSRRYRARRVRDESLIEHLRRLASERPRFGYRRLHVLLQRQGRRINVKRVYRIYRSENLSVRRRKRRKLRTTRAIPLPKATRPTERWAMDFTADGLACGRRLRTLNVVDTFTRECLAIEVDFSLPGARVVRVLDALIAVHGRPLTITVDNGPEFICTALDKWAFANGVQLHFIDPGKPTQNAYVESFNSKFRDECLAEAHWPNLSRARVEIEAWRIDYNTVRPHSALAYATPSEFAAASRAGAAA